MVVFFWKLHSDHNSLPLPAGAQVGAEQKIGRHTKSFMLHTLIPIVFNFLVETSFLADWHSVGGSGK